MKKIFFRIINSIGLLLILTSCSNPVVVFDPDTCMIKITNSKYCIRTIFVNRPSYNEYYYQVKNDKDIITNVSICNPDTSIFIIVRNPDTISFRKGMECGIGIKLLNLKNKKEEKYTFEIFNNNWNKKENIDIRKYRI